MPVAVVTGSSSGIGQRTALELAKRGYCVVVHAARRLSALQRSADAVRQHTDVLSVTADVGCPRACETLVQTAFAWRKRVDVWVNNAGADVLTTEQRTASFDKRLETLLRVDVAGTVRLSRMVADRMLAQEPQRGADAMKRDPNMLVSNKQNAPTVDVGPAAATLPQIINIGWDQAEVGMEGDPGQLFCTAKSAVTSFTRALAQTVAPAIRVNCVAPGWIKTAWGESSASDYWDDRAKAESLLGRWGEPADIAAAIAWLANPQSQFVNGQCIQVNGGRRYPV